MAIRIITNSEADDHPAGETGVIVGASTFHQFDGSQLNIFMVRMDEDNSLEMLADREFFIVDAIRIEDMERQLAEAQTDDDQ